MRGTAADSRARARVTLVVGRWPRTAKNRADPRKNTLRRSSRSARRTPTANKRLLRQREEAGQRRKYGARRGSKFVRSRRTSSKTADERSKRSRRPSPTARGWKSGSSFLTIVQKHTCATSADASRKKTRSKPRTKKIRAERSSNAANNVSYRLPLPLLPTRQLRLTAKSASARPPLRRPVLVVRPRRRRRRGHGERGAARGCGRPRPARRGAGRSAPPCRPGPASTIASATFSGLETIQRVSALSRSSVAGKPSVAMKPGRTMPTWTPCGALLGVERVGPADQGELARRVGAGAGAGDAARGAGDVDDRARRRGAQQRQQRLGEAHDGVEVELHVAVDVVVAALGEGAAPGGAGVVDEQRQAAARARRRGRGPARGRRPRSGRPRRRSPRRAATRPAPRSRSSRRATRTSSAPGLAGQPPRGRLADAARGSRDQRDHGRSPTSGKPIRISC